MAQSTVTAAAVVSYSVDLEQRSAELYRRLGERFPDRAAAFQEAAAECLKVSSQVKRVYQEAVTDALETGFSFAGLELRADLLSVADRLDIDMTHATQLEAAAIAFYEAASQCSSALLPSLARAFRRIASARRERAEAFGMALGDALRT